jgi:hypothetical protein
MSYTERTDATIRGLISASGDISYNNTTGVISYTDPAPRTDATIRGLISASGDISYDASTGVISYTDTDRSDATIRGLLSAANTGTGYGTLSYTASTGEFSFAKVTSANIRSEFTNGTGITIVDGQISANLGTVTSGSTDAITTSDAEAADPGTWYPTFVDGAGTSKTMQVDTNNADGLSYVPFSSTLKASIFSGTASAANYADLAEKYVADVAYEPGTVLVFGGDNEVTICTEKGDRKVAGIVSTDPAYLMNNALEGDTVVPLALTGRVPCNVIGTVAKGDMLVTSAIPGYAIVNNDPKLGTVLGKAVGAKDTEGRGVVEVVVGRM